MTLVFAGFETRKKIGFKSNISYIDGHDGFRDFVFVENPDDVKMEISGIYFAADSAITSGNKTLLNNFRKVYPVRVSLFRPNIAGGTFRGYVEEYLVFEVAIAFAGGTLSAQHYLNVITKHLANLRISYVKSYGPIKYTVLLDCQKNPLESGGVQFDDDTFLNADLKGVLNAEYIASVVLHSLNVGVSSARRYKLDADEFKSLFVEMALAVQCPAAKNHHLYKYTMKTVVNDGVNDVDVVLEEVGVNDVIVLGMPDRYKNDAAAVQNEIRQSGGSVAEGMFDYLNKIIDELNAGGNKSVAKPSILKVYESGKLGVKKNQKQ